MDGLFQQVNGFMHENTKVNPGVHDVRGKLGEECQRGWNGSSGGRRRGLFHAKNSVWRTESDAGIELVQN